MRNAKKMTIKNAAKVFAVLLLVCFLTFGGITVFALNAEPSEMPETAVSQKTVYDRNAAVEYAQKHYKTANTEEYYNFGNFFSRLKYSLAYLVRAGNGDCANFVSQCLYAGGIAQNDDWYHYIYYNEPIELKLFSDNPIVLGYHNQEGKYTLNSVRYNFSASWLGAISQYNYFSDKENGYINGDVITIKTADEVSLAARDGGIQKGDLLFWSENGETVAHATLVSDVTESDIFYTGHSQIGFNRSVSRTIADGEYKSVMIIRLNDSF